MAAALAGDRARSAGSGSSSCAVPDEAAKPGTKPMTIKVSKIREDLADREAIRDCLTRYARSVDRVDEAQLRAVYWEDATDNHITYRGPASGFIEQVIPRLTAIDQTSHMIGNMLIEIERALARVETYFLAFHRLPGPTGAFHDLVVGGRYLDRLEKREDEWRIAERMVVVDWFRDNPDSADWSRGFLGVDVQPGGRKPQDPSYRLFDG
jgi:3-phenylpropionate/cinnamic acid dioxygenase small subunit